ncbi:MAG: endonuclease [Parcubacteria group bacterium]|nr:MAG: endonuclease [Parcubacteria group bacterium]
MKRRRATFFKYAFYLKKLARNNRKNPTEPELRFWFKVIKNIPSNYKFHRQKPIGNFILDFYCSKLLLDVEIDGDSHFWETNNDGRRKKTLDSFGIKVIRYTNDQVMENLGGVYEDFLKQIQIRERVLKPPQSPLSGGSGIVSPLIKGARGI